jgi:hypothetical protein
VRPGNGRLSLCVHSTETNRLRERLEILEPNCDLSETATEGMIDILRENAILPRLSIAAGMIAGWSHRSQKRTTCIRL